VSDLDGTLLKSDGKVSAATKELIRAYQRKGGVFTIATGRMEDAVTPYLDHLELEGPVILYNGSKIIDINRNHVLYEAFLDYDTAKAALKLLRNYDWDVLLYQDRKIYIKMMTPGIEKHVQKEGVACHEVGDLYHFLKSAPTKILIIGHNGKFKMFEDELKQQLKLKVNFTQSEETYLEILPQGASKGAALKKLADGLKISMEEVIAIGDHLNDVSMIRAAGLGIAMENAHAELKNNASYITVSNDAEGVKNVIYRVLNDQEFSDDTPNADAS
jgi:Cof subfamily protein (haloacid dehalogenase superfamily)